MDIKTAPIAPLTAPGLGPEGRSHGLQNYIEMKCLCIGDSQRCADPRKALANPHRYAPATD